MNFLLRVAFPLLVLACAMGINPSLAVAQQPAGSAQPVTVTRATLRNGMHVIVLRDTLAPVVTAVLNYRIGADDEPIYGIAHATEHMMFRGSKTLDASQLAEVTAVTGGDFDADTQNEITQYFFTMPSQYLDIALHLEASRASGLLLDQSLWNQERGAIEQEVVQDNSQALYRLGIKVQQHLMAGTPYADDGLGSLESFGKHIQAPQLRAFYAAWYHPNNAVYVIAGDVDPRATLDRVASLFGSIPAARLPARRAVALHPLTPATFSDVSDQPYTIVSLNYRFPGYDDPDFAAGQVLADVLNSQRSNLYALTAAGKALGSELDPTEFPKAAFAQLVSYVPVSTKPQTALGDLRTIVAAYRLAGVPPELVAAAKDRELADAAFKGNSIEGLAFEWSQAVAVEQRRSPDDDVRAIGRVTVADVNRVLRRYLDDRTATVAYAVPKSAGAGSGGEGRHTENNTIPPTKHAPLPAFAQHVLDNLAVPPATTHPSRFILANGLTVIVQPEGITPTVVLHGTIRSDEALQAPALPAGVAGLTSQMLPFGTERYDRLGYATELDKIAADVSTGTSFSLSVLSKHFERGLQLLAEDELHPAFPAAAFPAVRARTAGELEGEATSPDHLAEVRLAQDLYPEGDPARRFPTAEGVGRATLADVKAWYAMAYRPDLATIVVTGDVTPEAARDAVARYFGDWKAEGPKPNVDLPAVAANAPSSTTIPATGRVQSSVTLAETLAFERSNADYAPLAVGNTVLSGGFYASQLYRDLRETHGYVYSVGTELAAGKTRSTFALDFGASPQNVEPAQALALSDIRAMGITLLDQERLRRAKALLLGEVPIREQSYDGVTDTLLEYASEGLPLDQNLIDARAELDASAESVRSAFAKWIRPNGFARVIVGPAPQ